MSNMQIRLPRAVEDLIDEKIPELSIDFMDEEGWFWTYRCAESDDCFENWQEALLDFAITCHNELEEMRLSNEEED